MATIKRSTAVEALYSNDPPPIKWGDVSAADQLYSVITTSTVTEANHMILVIAFALVSLVLVVSTFKVANAKKIATSRKGAESFLSYTADWAKWMAGIQTAALGVLALATLDKDYLYGRELNDCQTALAVFTFVFLGSALLASAWVLSSIPSQAIRLHSVTGADTEPKTEFDIYEQQLYGWVKKGPFTFGWLLTVKHILWVVGLLSLAALAITIHLNHPAAEPCNPSCTSGAVSE